MDCVGNATDSAVSSCFSHLVISSAANASEADGWWRTSTFRRCSACCTSQGIPMLKITGSWKMPCKMWKTLNVCLPMWTFKRCACGDSSCAYGWRLSAKWHAVLCWKAHVSDLDISIEPSNLSWTFPKTALEASAGRVGWFQMLDASKHYWRGILPNKISATPSRQSQCLISMAYLCSSSTLKMDNKRQIVPHCGNTIGIVICGPGPQVALKCTCIASNSIAAGRAIVTFLATGNTSQRQSTRPQANGR